MRVFGVLSAQFGLAFALLPQAVLAPYGVTLDAGGTFVARLFGAANIGFGIALWLGVGRDAETERGLAWGVVAYSLVEAVATILAISGGVANSLAWGFVVLDGVFIGACALSMRRAGVASAERSAVAIR